MDSNAASTPNHPAVPRMEAAAAETPPKSKGFWLGDPWPRLKHFTDDGEPIGYAGGSVLEVAMMGKHPACITAEYASQQVDVCCQIGRESPGVIPSRRAVIAAAGEALIMEAVHPDRRSIALVEAIAALPM